MLQVETVGAVLQSVMDHLSPVCTELLAPMPMPLSTISEISATISAFTDHMEVPCVVSDHKLA